MSKITIIGENISLTPAIKAYVENKTKNTLQKTGDPESIQFRIGKDKHIFYVKALTNFHKKEIYIKDEKDDLYHAVDSILKRLSAKLNNIKETALP